MSSDHTPMMPGASRHCQEQQSQVHQPRPLGLDVKRSCAAWCMCNMPQTDGFPLHRHPHHVHVHCTPCQTTVRSTQQAHPWNCPGVLPQLGGTLLERNRDHSHRRPCCEGKGCRPDAFVNMLASAKCSPSSSRCGRALSPNCAGARLTSRRRIAAGARRGGAIAPGRPLGCAHASKPPTPVTSLPHSSPKSSFAMRLPCLARVAVQKASSSTACPTHTGLHLQPLQRPRTFLSSARHRTALSAAVLLHTAGAEARRGRGVLHGVGRKGRHALASAGVMPPAERERRPVSRPRSLLSDGMQSVKAQASCWRCAVVGVPSTQSGWPPTQYCCRPQPPDRHIAAHAPDDPPASHTTPALARRCTNTPALNMYRSR